MERNDEAILQIGGHSSHMRAVMDTATRVPLVDTTVRQILDRLRNMTKRLQALDPALQAPRPGRKSTPPLEQERLKGGRPSRSSRRRSGAPDGAGNSGGRS